jgi:hypothetical protein
VLKNISNPLYMRVSTPVENNDWLATF